MAKIYEVERKEISRQAQRILKSIKPTTSANDKVNAALALSVLALLSPETEISISQQFLKFVKDLQK
jgi:hypothetical protein